MYWRGAVRTDENLESGFRNSKEWKTGTTEKFQIQGTDEQGRRYVQSFSGHEPNKLFLNDGGVKFSDISALSGLDSDSDGRTFGLMDYDQDGWQDLALVNSNSPQLEIFRNQIHAHNINHSVAFRLVGGKRDAQPGSKMSNRDAFGAVVTVESGGKRYTRELRCGEGFATQNSRTMLIGLGETGEIDSVEIRWPSGKTQVLNDVQSGTINLVHEGGEHTSKPFEKPVVESKKSLISIANLKIPGAPINKPVVYVTMATWCPACKENLPQVALLKERFGDKFDFVGLPVDLDDSVDELKAYQEELKPAYRILTDLARQGRQTVSQFSGTLLKRNVLPSTFVATENGDIVFASVGVPTLSDLAKLIYRIEEKESVNSATRASSIQISQ